MTRSQPSPAESTETDQSHPPLAAHLPSNARELATYLHDRLEEEDEYYVKSRFIAEEIDLSSKQIGVYLGRLENKDTGIDVEQWGHSNSTTWRVRLE